MTKNLKFLVLFYVSLLLVSTATATDVAKEKRWADQIIDGLMDGEPVWLNAAGHEFLAIDTPNSEGNQNKALIVVHGIGVHPNWDQIIQPMRVEMTERGWRTLSIQMPILPNEAESREYFPLFYQTPKRFQAAIQYLKSTGSSDITIVAHSLGSAMSAFYLAKSNDQSIRAFVAIGLNAAQQNKSVNAASSLEKISIPVLEIYGSKDLPQVLETAEKRSIAAQKSGNIYSQKVVEGANHFFDEHTDILIDEVSEWLATQD
mgnify:FL=1